MMMRFRARADSGMLRGAGGVVYWFATVRGERRDLDVSAAPEIAAALTHAFGEPLRSIVGMTHAVDMRAEVLADCQPLQRWGQGLVTLLGDAAHPMLPHAGQGAAQALEDAVALGLALRHGRPDVSALRRYEDVRSRRTAKLVRLARRLAAVRTSAHPSVEWMRNAVIRVTPAAVVHLARLSRPGDPHAALRA
jgi:2-polyprenyl-6-methoxyphenol hydroxylase-like FAD-dependent oxidoreductase